MLSPKRANFAPCRSCQARAARIQAAEPVLHLGILPMADHDLAVEPQARVEEPGLAVAMRGLVEVHEIHVDLAPRQVAVELGVEMDERLAERGETADPHLRGREGVHPQDETGAIRVVVGVEAERPDLVRGGEQGLEDDLQRNPLGGAQRQGDFF